MSAVDDAYPVSCAFCNISAAYPVENGTDTPAAPDPSRVSPQCHLILSTPHVLAFLDIMPIAPGHILLTTRKHYEKLGDLQPPAGPRPLNWITQRAADETRASARALGEWLPVLSRAMCSVTGVEDWNVVQNNGHRAAQVVPHIHFHLIPRYQDGRLGPKRTPDVGMLKSWKMFGRGTREDLDDDEGAEMAKLLREAIQKETAATNATSKL